MATRRMFSQDIVTSDAFLDMPISSQVLYFHLSMRADDDGFVNPKMVMRLIGSSSDDLTVLLVKRFLLSFESGVVVVKHWLIHNLIRSDLYKETMYKKEKKTLGLNENGAYTELRSGIAEIKKIESPEWLRRRRGDVRTANVPQTALRIGKDRIGKVSKDMSEKSDVEVERFESFDYFWELYPKKELKKKSREIWVRKNLESKKEMIMDFVVSAKSTDRWKKGYVKQPPTFLNGECWNDDLSSYNDKKNINKVAVI